MFDLVYFTKCFPAPSLQHSILVFGNLEYDIYLCLFLENHIVIDSHATGKFTVSPREAVYDFIEEHYGCFARKKDNPKSSNIVIDKLPW